MFATTKNRFQNMLIMLQEAASHMEDEDLSGKEQEALRSLICLCGLIHDEMSELLEA
jgi:hypothetical protein